VDLGSQYQNVSILDFVGAKGDGGGGDSWSYKMCKAQSNCHHQQINTQLFTGQVPVHHPTNSAKALNCPLVVRTKQLWANSCFFVLGLCLSLFP